MELPTAPGSPLHLSQKFFWFSFGIAILVGAGVVITATWRGQSTTIKLLDMELTLQKTTQTVDSTVLTLLKLRNNLVTAKNSDNETDFAKAMAEFDTSLQSLGVAQSELEKQKLRVRKQLENGGYSGGYGGGSYWTATPISTYSNVVDQPAYEYTPTYRQEPQAAPGNPPQSPPGSNVRNPAPSQMPLQQSGRIGSKP